MHPSIAIAIAQSRASEMQARAATARLAASLRADRPRRATIAGVAIAGLVRRIRDTGPAPAAPCATC